MEYKLRPSIVSQTKVSYAKMDDDAHHPAPAIDCSAGSNPFGMPRAAREAIGAITAEQVNLYPHYAGLKKRICERFSGISPRNIMLANGSMDAIYQINTLFLRDDAKILGICPQFSDYMSHAKLLGMDYRAVPLREANHYRFSGEEVLAELDPSDTVVYLDNPNNPTGQIIPLDTLRAIAEKTRAQGTLLVIDEAYGDFMEECNSGAQLLHDYDNVIVLRTFSKGWGLAGLRAGFTLASEQIIAALEKIGNPYTISEPARVICEAAMTEPDFLPYCRSKIARCTQLLRATLGGALRLSETGDTVPISLLIHRDKTCDLAALLMQHGVAAVSGGDFIGLAPNSARLRLPHPAQFDALLHILQTIDRA